MKSHMPKNMHDNHNKTTHTTQTHFIVMFCIMILAGFLSTMNTWNTSWNNIYFSLNDLYMVLLMTGWMLFFMGIYYKYFYGIIIGLVLIIFSFVAIRNQLFITEDQFLRGMIPHHAMAILMAESLKNKPNSSKTLINNIITTQNKEINEMKEKLDSLRN